jgi:hypothetical protein
MHSLHTSMSWRGKLGLLLLLGTWSAMAQPTLNADTYRALIGNVYVNIKHPVNFGTSSETQTQVRQALQALIALQGAGQTWDFSTFTYQEPITSRQFYLPYSDTLPGAMAFLQADHVVQVREGVYLYGALRQDEGQFYYGFVVGDSVMALPPNDPFPALHFPLTYGTPQWSWPSASFDLEKLVAFLVVFSGDSSLAALYKQYKSLLQNASVTILWQVDGYGTLVTPAGSASCLRLKRTVRVQGLPPPFPSTQDVAIDYLYLTEDLRLAAEIVTRLVFSFTLSLQPSAAAYSVSDWEPVAQQPAVSVPEALLQAPYPNPFMQQTVLTLSLPTPQLVAVRIYNLLGQEVAQPHWGWLTAGTHRISISAEGWAAGVYVCLVEAGPYRWTYRLVVRP